MSRKHYLPILALAIVLLVTWTPAVLAAGPEEVEASVAFQPAEVTLSQLLQDTSCSAPGPEPQLPLATPADLAQNAGGTFYICLTSNTLCGSCPSGTLCATEACGPLFRPACTFQVACVTSCQFTSCRQLASSCE
jgi:hypothetical protein